MKKEEKKKMIAPVLKKMNVGDTEEFDFSRFESVRITASRMQSVWKAGSLALTRKVKQCVSHALRKKQT